ncbi:MAG: hypothetical protein QME12_07530 [Nanoarchaeota archaeon]|nr:hypothetical protein [Nanoarchaeota archaeon]
MRKESLPREAPARIQRQPVAEFFGGGFYITAGNTEQVQLYQTVNTPMTLELSTGSLYA